MEIGGRLMVGIAAADLGDGVPDGLDRQYAMALQAMVGRLPGHFDGLVEQVDALSVGWGIAGGIFNLVNEVKRLAQHVGRVLTEGGRGKTERRDDERDEEKMADAGGFHGVLGVSF